MAGGAADFLRRLNEQNQRIADRQAAEEKAKDEGGIDQIQLKRDQERRERWGQLRARPHPSKRNKHASPVWDSLPDGNL